MPILQLSVFAENKPGAMTAITRILGEAGVDIRALSLADTSDYGILRLIVDKPEQAQKALDLGLSALTKVQEISDSAKAGIARKMGLATQKEVDALREELEAKLAASEKAE